jgi:hypothetical protein
MFNVELKPLEDLRLDDTSRSKLKTTYIDGGQMSVSSGERGPGYPSIYISKKRSKEELEKNPSLPESKTIAALSPTAEELAELIIHLKARLAYTLVEKIKRL